MNPFFALFSITSLLNFIVAAMPLNRLDAALGRVNGVKGHLLILLHILIVRQRQSLHDREHGHKGAVHPAGLSPDQLRDIRVFLLGHDAAAGAVGVIQLHEPVFIRVPDDHFLGKTAQMHHDGRQGCQEFNGVIPVCHGIHGCSWWGHKSPEALPYIPGQADRWCLPGRLLPADSSSSGGKCRADGSDPA